MNFAEGPAVTSASAPLLLIDPTCPKVSPAASSGGAPWNLLSSSVSSPGARFSSALAPAFPAGPFCRPVAAEPPPASFGAPSVTCAPQGSGLA